MSNDEVRAFDPLRIPRPLRLANSLASRLGSRQPKALRLDVDELLSTAREKARLFDFGPPTFREGLDRLVDSLEAEGRLSPFGRLAFRQQLVGLLVNRLRVRDWQKKHPVLEYEEVRAPLMVLGMPRTGTTLVSFLLDQDPMNRSVLAWEAANVAPPPTIADRWEDDRLVAAIQADRRRHRLAPHLQAMHPMSPTIPTECVSLLAGEFTSVHFETLALIESYGEWLRDCDMAPAYGFHKLQLQILQSTVPVERWALKTPVHTWHLDALHAVYPDARLVWCHRDPVVAVNSTASLVTALQTLHSDQVSPPDIGHAWRDKCLHAVTAGTEARGRLGLDDTIFDLQYAELIDDPVGAIERIYQHFDLELSELGRRRMQAWLEARPQDAFGRHRYQLSDFGLDERELRGLFADYVTRYEVPTERPPG
ncbi:MAG: sulfotransferase [Acidimicrobiales bacterium]|nr:sulfotransferase [Acidimicrobiales bacterium]